MGSLSVVPEALIEDLQRKLLLVDADRGHGKSRLVREMIPLFDDRIIKVFDASQVWYHCSSLPHRRLVSTLNDYDNIENCVYEIGALSDDDRRVFVATIIREDFEERYNNQLLNPNYVKDAPRILYILEEANTYIRSQVLNRKGWVAQVMRDFVSTGRNYGLDCILIATRVSGEVSPGFRNRCNWVLGRVSGDGEKRHLRGATDKHTVEVAGKLPLYKFLYYNGVCSTPFYLPETVFATPRDCELPISEYDGLSISIENGFHRLLKWVWELPWWLKLVIIILLWGLL